MKRLLMHALFLIIISSLVYAEDVPEIGHQFYGYAGSGSTISAVVNGVTFTTPVASNKYYGYSPVFFVDAASEGISGGEDGQTITFYIDGTQTTTYTFAVGGVTKLDFATDLGLTTGGATDSDGDGIPDEYDTTPAGTTGTTPTDDSDDDDDDSDRDYSSSSSGGKKVTTTSSGSGCYHKWQCTSWNACEENGFQTRICYYVGNCTTEGNQSDTRQRCTYTAPAQTPVEEPTYASCYDGIKNQGEKNIDCGGPCEACEETLPVTEEPKTKGLYIALGIFIILLIIAIILGYKYKDKWMPYWEKLKSRFVKPAAKPTVATPYTQYAQQNKLQQQYKPQYSQYRR